MPTLPECGSRAVIVTLTCAHCGESTSQTLNLPSDVPLLTAQPTYCCSKCTPKVETLSKRDDFLKQLEPKWEAAGGRTAHKRALGRTRTKRWRDAHPDEYRASQREIMRRRRTA